MRDLLTGLAIILIVVLSAALVGPYFVDWNSQRSFLEARLSHALGQKVTIGGNIDLKLLPTPYLVLDQTVIGGDEGQVRIGIRHLNLELSVTPLLHGEFDFTEARLREPTLRMALQPDRSLPAFEKAPALDANLRFDRIVVSDGTIAIADPQSGRNLVLDHLDFTADASSLSGPFKGSGIAGATQTKFRFATASAEKDRTKTHLVIDETSEHAGLDLDGVFAFAAGESALEPSFEGNMALSSHVRTSNNADIAWTLSGPIKADAAHASLDGGTLRLGSEDSGLSLDASATADLRETPKVALDLSAKQLDIDRLSGAPTDATKPPPPRLPDVATLRRLVENSAPPIPVALDAKVDTATYGGETLSDLAAHLDLGTSTQRTIKLSGDGPGGLHLAIDGQAAPSKTEIFTGTIALGADDVPAALKWLSSISPDVTLSAKDMPFTKATARARVSATPTNLSASDLALTLDRSDMVGSARFAYATDKKAALLTARVDAKALDIDALPTLDTLRGAAGSIDLDVALGANAIKVSRLGDSNLEAGRLRLDLKKIDRHLEVTQFRAEDVGGATIVGTGSVDPDKAAITLTMDASKLADVAEVVRRLAPGRASDGLAHRAPALAPAHLKLDAAFAGDKGHFEATRFDIGGTLAATKIDAHLSPDRTRPDSLGFAASADAPEGRVLLDQLGFTTLPLDLLGASRISIKANRDEQRSFDTVVDGSFGGTRFSMQGRSGFSGAAQGGSGSFTVKGDDISPLLQSLALAFPDLTGRIPVDLKGGIAASETGIALSDLKGSIAGTAIAGGVKWDTSDSAKTSVTGSVDLDRVGLAGLLGLALGPAEASAKENRFSNAPFAAGLIDPPRTDLKLNAKTLDLGLGLIAQKASLNLGLAPNLVRLSQVTAQLAGGNMAGDVTVRRNGKQAGVEGKLRVDAVDLRLPSLEGKVSGTLDFAGSGASSLALVSSLAGSGAASVNDLRISGADPKALKQVFQAVESDELTVDQDSVLRAYDAAAKAPLAAGSRGFKLGLASGTLRFDGTETSAAAGTATTSDTDGSLDLAQMRSSTTTTETLESLPKDWTGAPPSISVTWAGPITAPTRRVDVANLLNAVAARALARESARIEAYEFDIRERAFFNARLRADQRREDDRLKAEDDAREAARLAAEKAAQEKADKEKAARDKAASQDPQERAPEPPHAPTPGAARRFDAPSPGTPSDPSAAGRY